MRPSAVVGQDVVRAAFELDGGKRIAARAGRRVLADAVAEVVADDRLHRVGEIRQQRRYAKARLRTYGDNRVDGLEDRPNRR